MPRPHEHLADAATRLRTSGCYDQAARLDRAAFHARRSSLAASADTVSRGEVVAAGAARIAARLLEPLGHPAPVTGLLAMAEQLLGAPIIPAAIATAVPAVRARQAAPTPASPITTGHQPTTRRSAATAT